jgi:hypothetical protein
VNHLGLVSRASSVACVEAPARGNSVYREAIPAFLDNLRVEEREV